MPTIELYADETEAMTAHAHYNHNLGRRAVVVLLEDAVPYVDFYGYGSVFIENVTENCWMLVVEDLVVED